MRKYRILEQIKFGSKKVYVQYNYKFLFLFNWWFTITENRYIYEDLDPDLDFGTIESAKEYINNRLERESFVEITTIIPYP